MKLTKKLQFDNDALDVLKNMDWRDNGTLGVITGGQLSRDLYVKVNKALEAMGGKWNRSKGGHLFQFDPRPSVEGLIENGVLEVERDGFFETPRKVVERMIDLVPFSEDDYIFEPSAGKGAIVDVLRQNGARNILVLEKNQDRRSELISKGYNTAMHSDFLTYDNWDKFDRIYMNPPFENLQDIDHVQHAFEQLRGGGQMVSVMSSSPFFRMDKKAVEFRDWLCSKGGYSEQLPSGSFKESGTGVNTVLVVISKAEG